MKRFILWLAWALLGLLLTAIAILIVEDRLARRAKPGPEVYQQNIKGE